METLKCPACGGAVELFKGPEVFMKIFEWKMKKKQMHIGESFCANMELSM